MTIATSPLHEMTLCTPTRYWMDSCSMEELRYALPGGISGATSNPVIVLNVLKKEMHLWRARILQIICEQPTWTETQVSWQVYQEIARSGAQLLLPLFAAENQQHGRLSIQVDPALYRSAAAMLAQVESFATLAPNFQIKIPATQAGIELIEEATYRGINLTVTVAFTVAQAIAAAESFEQGLKRRAAAGKEITHLRPMVAMMVGRTDDWLKVAVKQAGSDINPDYLEWGGVACFKKAYELYQQRGYRARLLTAAYRNFLHWTEFVGGEVTLTIPYEWQLKFNASAIKPTPRMHIPVEPAILDELYSKLPEFRRAYDEDGLSVAEFDHYGATVRTLRSFIEAWHLLVAQMRDLMLPNPDLPA